MSVLLGQEKLCYRQRFGGYSTREVAPRVVKVVRYTPKQVVCKIGDREARFILDDGREIGGDYGSHVEPLTDLIREEIKQCQLSDKISQLAYKAEELSRKIAQRSRRGLVCAELEMQASRLADMVDTFERWLK